MSESLHQVQNGYIHYLYLQQLLAGLAVTLQHTALTFQSGAFLSLPLELCEKAPVLVSCETLASLKLSFYGGPL